EFANTSALCFPSPIGIVSFGAHSTGAPFWLISLSVRLSAATTSFRSRDRLFDRSLNVLRLPFLPTFVGQISCSNGGFYIFRRPAMRQRIDGKRQVYPRAIRAVPCVGAEVINRFPPRHVGVPAR